MSGGWAEPVPRWSLHLGCLVLIVPRRKKRTIRCDSTSLQSLPEDKLPIVLEGLKESTTISVLCRRHGISRTSYYKWRDEFFDGGKGALTSNGAAKTSSEADKARIAEPERVIGQQAVEIQIFKEESKLLRVMTNVGLWGSIAAPSSSRDHSHPPTAVPAYRIVPIREVPRAP